MVPEPYQMRSRAEDQQDSVFIPPDRPLWSLLYTRSGTQDGTDPTDDILMGPPGPNTHYVGTYDITGDDIIDVFERSDVFATDVALHEIGKEEVILDDGILLIKGPEQGDSVKFQNPAVEGLRFLGERDLLFVYGVLAARPREAIEGTLGQGASFGTDTLVGTDGRDLFFFDTGLRLDLGRDVIKNFDAGDRIITTSALIDPNMDGRIKADVSDRFGIRDTVETGPELGSGIAKIFASNGRAVSTLLLEEVVESELGPLYVYARAGDHSSPPEISF